MAKKCRYERCIRLAGAKHDDCAACRARFRYWDKQSAAKRLKRRRKLELFGETMREFVTDAKLRVLVNKEYQKEKKANG